MARGIFTALTALTAAALNDAFSPPRCRLTNSAAFVHNSTGNNLAITFDTETIDSGGMHSTSTNTSRITIPTGGAGMYLLGGGIEFAVNATGYRQVALRVNGTTAIASSRSITASATVTVHIMANTIYPLNAGDYVELIAFQNSGGNLNITSTAEFSPIFYANWLSVL